MVCLRTRECPEGCFIVSTLAGDCHYIYSPNDHDLPLIEVVIVDKSYRCSIQAERHKHVRACQRWSTIARTVAEVTGGRAYLRRSPREAAS